jgi:hypothetical protein
MTPKQHAMSLLTWVRTVSESMLKDIPETAMTKLCSPTDNHPLWVLGHLAATDVWIADMVGAKGVTVPESYNKLFGSGTKPVADPKGYPKTAEVKALFDSNRKAILAWLEAATESQLAEPLKEKSGGFATDPIDAMHKIAWHEGWHMGQIATVRKSLNLKPAM